MNTGLQDAANLAWKLLACLRGAGSDSLLDSYQAERLPVAHEVLEFTDRLFNLAAGQRGWQAHLRDLVAPVVVHEATGLDKVQHRAFRKFGQLDIAYPPQTLGLNEGVQQEVSPAVGQRAPNAQLSRHQDLFDLTGGYRFTLLALSRAHLSPAALELLKSELAELRDQGIDSHIVGRLTYGQDPAVARTETPDVLDRYGVEHQALVLVRPDGYIAWRGESFDTRRCRELLPALGFPMTLPSPAL